MLDSTTKDCQQLLNNHLDLLNEILKKIYEFNAKSEASLQYMDWDSSHINSRFLYKGEFNKECHFQKINIQYATCFLKMLKNPSEFSPKKLEIVEYP